MKIKTKKFFSMSVIRDYLIRWKLFDISSE